MVVFIVISKTNKPLWDNDIPKTLYDFIKKESSLKTENEIHHSSRHTFVIIEAFRSFYGYRLEHCQFAKLKTVPDFVQCFYEVAIVPSYQSSNYGEHILININQCLEQLKSNTNNQIYYQLKQQLYNISFEPVFCYRHPKGFRYLL